MKKIFLLVVIFVISIILNSCKTKSSQPNQVIEEEYYEVGLVGGSSGDPGILQSDFPCTGLRTKNTISKEQPIDVYYGFDKTVFNGIIYESIGTTSNNNTLANHILTILNESDLMQEIKFTLYRICIATGREAIQQEVYSFTNSLGWFYSSDFNFEFKLEENKYVDVIKYDEIEFGYNKECYIHYRYELTPVDGDVINLKAYGDTIENIQKYIDRVGIYTPPVFYDNPTRIASGRNPHITAKKKDNGEFCFLKPENNNYIC